nr:hypothetical protein Iba_chr13eCG6430 [Ipomoea batatas]
MEEKKQNDVVCWNLKGLIRSRKIRSVRHRSDWSHVLLRQQHQESPEIHGHCKSLFLSLFFENRSLQARRSSYRQSFNPTPSVLAADIFAGKLCILTFTKTND